MEKIRRWGDSDPAAGKFIAGNIPSGYYFKSLNNWTFADTAQQVVKDVFNNYANMTLEDIFRTIGIATTETIQIDGTDVYPREYEKLSGRSMFCFVENGKYTLDVTGSLSCEVISKSLMDKVYDDYEVNIVCCNLDVQTAKLYLSGVYNIDQATGYIRDLELGVYFLIERKYLPQKIEAGTYYFIDTPDLDGDDASNAEGYLSKGSNVEEYIEFSSNNQEFINIFLDANTGKIYYVTSDYDEVEAYDVESGWTNNAYKKIEFLADENYFNYFAYKWAITDGNLVKQDTSETWYLNNTLTLTNLSTRLINFTSNGTQYLSLDRTYVDDEDRVTDVASYNNSSTSDNVYVDGSWVDQAYRTITFDEPITDTTLIEWLQANGTLSKTT